MSEVQQLLRLQTIDTEIQEKKLRLGEVIRLQREPDELVSTRQMAAAAAESLKNWKTRQVDLNLALDSLNSKAEASEDRLYSGRVTNPKELTDLQNEIDSLVRRRELLEDQILETMIEIEEAEEGKSAADDRMASLESGWSRALALYRTEQMELAQRLNTLMDMRQKQLALVPAAILREYDALFKTKQGLAVTTLRGNLCMGCQLNVSAAVVKAVAEGSVVFCNHCDRILVQKWS